MNYATSKLMKPAPGATDFPRALVNDVKNMNAALETFVMFFTNVNTINDDSILKLVTQLREAGRADLADDLVLSGIAAGLRGEG